MSNETYRQFDPWRPSPVKEISRRQIVETHYFNVDHVSYESNQIGSFERYFVQELNGDTVAVLAVTEDGMIPLVEQYRIANHRWTLEIPAGHANNPSERPTDVAKRKLAEEAGFDADKFTQFTRFMNTPSYSTQHTSISLPPVSSRCLVRRSGRKRLVLTSGWSRWTRPMKWWSTARFSMPKP